MYEYQLFILLSAAVFCLIGLLFIIMINVVGFAEYLSSRNATSKDKAVELDESAQRRYVLIIPFANKYTGILRKSKNKYWLKAKDNAGIKVWYVMLITIFMGVFAYLLLNYMSTIGTWLSMY